MRAFLNRLFGGTPPAVPAAAPTATPATPPAGVPAAAAPAAPAHAAAPPATPPAVGSAPMSEPAKGWVSVWIGDFTDELDLDGYLGPAFRRDHGCRAHENSAYCVHPAPRPLDKLLAEHSLSTSWAPALLAANPGQSASCALVFLHYRHVPGKAAAGPLRFLGSVRMG